MATPNLPQFRNPRARRHEVRPRGRPQNFQAGAGAKEKHPPEDPGAVQLRQMLDTAAKFGSMKTTEIDAAMRRRAEQEREERRAARITGKVGRPSGGGNAPATINTVTRRFQPPPDDSDDDPDTKVGAFAAAATLPDQVAQEKVVLRAKAYFQEAVAESPGEPFRIRRVELRCYLEDLTIEIYEASIDNSGAPQGMMLRRSRIPKRQEVRMPKGKEEGDEEEECFDWRDLMVGDELQIYGRVMRIYDVDDATRAWFAQRGIPQADPLPVPDDPFEARKAVAEQAGPRRANGDFKKKMYGVKEYQEARLGREVVDARRGRQFLENDGKVLRFDCLWRDKRMFGNNTQYVLNYYLADDMVEVREVHPRNGGKDPWSALLKKQPLPRDWRAAKEMDAKPRSHPDAFVRPGDLVVGGRVDVFGRDLEIRACDRATRAWYRDVFGRPQPRTTWKPEAKAATREVVPPPHNGIGDPDDSLQSTKTFNPKPPRKDFNKWYRNQGVVFRFKARLVGLGPIDSERRFTIACYPEDDSVQVYEPPRPNMGGSGGKFLARNKYRKASGALFTAADFVPGTTVQLVGRRFRIDDADPFTRSEIPELDRPCPFDASDNLFPRPAGTTAQLQADPYAAAAERTAGSVAAGGGGAPRIRATDRSGAMAVVSRFEGYVDALQERLVRCIGNLNPGATKAELADTLGDLLAAADRRKDGYMEEDSFLAAVTGIEGMSSAKRNELEGLFFRYADEFNKQLSYQEFALKLFGVLPNPEGDPVTRSALKRMRRAISQRGGGIHSIRSLGRQLRIMDDNGNKRLDRSELQYGLRDFGMSDVTAADAEAIINAFDRNRDGQVDVDEFLRGLRGRLNQRRARLVRLAFNKVDRDGSGIVTIEDMRKGYNAHKHRDVLSGKKTVRQVLEEFMDQWDTLEQDWRVSLAEFEDYYKDVSASIDDDEYFELMIVNAWHLVDGDLAAINTTNKRVRVVFEDGREEIIMVRDDMGMDPDDFHDVKDRLNRQGVRGIVEIHTRG